MLNQTSLDAVNSSITAITGGQDARRLVKPLYDSYCFSQIPETVRYLLTGQGKSALPPDVFGNLPTRYDKVILFFIDAFGWRFFERYAEKYEFLKTILRDGVVSKLTSQFPSTTAAHVTSINTGLNVGQSGVYEWHYYEPLVDEIISPLLFAYARDKVRETLKQQAIPAQAFYPKHTFYQTLQSSGITSTAFQGQAYATSTYSNVVFQGATVLPYRWLSEAFTLLSELLLSDKVAPAYYFLYFERIDTIGHVHGPDSAQFEQEVDVFLRLMEEHFYRPLHGNVGGTLFMMTADHGQVEVNPQTTFYLNLQAPGIEQYLRSNRKGSLLVPAGSARDMFLHVIPHKIDEAIVFLRKYLGGRAEVYKTQTLLEQHFFGSQQPSTEFLSRVGNVVVLPHQNETVWWYEENVFDMHFFGHHGGLTPEEMEIPLLLLPL